MCFDFYMYGDLKIKVVQDILVRMKSRGHFKMNGLSRVQYACSQSRKDHWEPLVFVNFRILTIFWHVTCKRLHLRAPRLRKFHRAYQAHLCRIFYSVTSLCSCNHNAYRAGVKEEIDGMIFPKFIFCICDIYKYIIYRYDKYIQHVYKVNSHSQLSNSERGESKCLKPTI